MIGRIETVTSMMYCAASPPRRAAQMLRIHRINCITFPYQNPGAACGVTGARTETVMRMLCCSSTALQHRLDCTTSPLSTPGTRLQQRRGAHRDGHEHALLLLDHAELHADLQYQLTALLTSHLNVDTVCGVRGARTETVMSMLCCFSTAPNCTPFFSTS